MPQVWPRGGDGDSMRFSDARDDEDASVFGSRDASSPRMTDSANIQDIPTWIDLDEDEASDSQFGFDGPSGSGLLRMSDGERAYDLRMRDRDR